MAPVKKSKSINKGFAVLYDSSPGKEEKSKPKKRKLSDMLGPQWSKVELQRFYEAYRKYGKDWKKVASVVRSRSTEMVEALYNMNRAYLSLPEGTASVSGLIAMMTDHYNVMDGSGSEKETEDTPLMARKVHKHPKAKGRLDYKREISLQRPSVTSSEKPVQRNSLQHPAISSSDRSQSGFSFFDGIRPNIPVKKRTPRVPVSCLNSYPNKKPRKSIMNGNADELAHESSLSPKAGLNTISMHGSQTTPKRFDHLTNSQPSAREKKPKSGGFASDENSMDDSSGSYEARTEKVLSDGVDSRLALGDLKKVIKGKKKVEISETKVFDNVRDTFKLSDKRPRIYEGFLNDGAKIDRSPSRGQRRKTQEHIIEDERIVCDALQSLAEMSVLMPHLDTESDEHARAAVTVRDSTAEADAKCNVALQEESPVFSKKRKPRSSKVTKVEQLYDDSRKQARKEALAGEEVKSADSTAPISTVGQRCESSVKSPAVSLSNGEHMVETEVAVSCAQAQASSHIITPSRRKNRRKRDKTILQKDLNHAPSFFSSKCSSSDQDRVHCANDKMLHSLSCPEVRRWCAYEWFYSAIDYPWFAKREFVEYLNHVGLAHIPRLTRVEWGVIRSSLGKPRRFSERFLQEERDKLEQYRESVRTHYANLRAGLGDGLPTDLARPLSVGQQVVAIHPKTRELQNGSVLAVDRQSCLVQFDRQDFGVEFVMDIDCMPLNPVENMPELLRRQKMFNHQPIVRGAFTSASDEHVRNLDPLCRVPSFSPAVANDMKVEQVSIDSHPEVAGNGSLRASEGDMRRAPCLTQALDKKVFRQHCVSPGKLPWTHTEGNTGAVNGTLHFSDSSMLVCEEISSNVVEIVQGSREKAQKMVDVAVKVVSSMREGEDAYGQIDEAFDSSIKGDRVTNCRTASMMMSSTMPPQNPVASCSPEPQLSSHVSSAKPDASDVQIPSELITSCVATLLMIQSCTERQCPPAEVAQILDNAVTSLQPCCSQNLSIYREIQMCMGRIKTQILALVPT
ncbi:hypothetical protein RND81_04G205300 [Saponaria officinalis]|uniref:SANT domain-containing protein n=1 Tax=Saponaria officinalis TaxID=3572 RepID=A0AAW1LFL0_SAPOF